MRTEKPAPSAFPNTGRPTGWSKPSISMSSSHPTQTPVRATLKLKPNPAAAAPAPLVLDGDGLTLVSLKIDGAPVAADATSRRRTA